MSDALQIHLPSDALSEVQVQPSSPRDSAVAGPFDCVKKLTHDQVKSGWREGFSSTMARPYFYNIFTRESVWSIPDAMSTQLESGSAPDILQTAIAELTADGVAQARRNNQKPSTSTPVDYTAPQYIKGKQGEKRKFSPDPDQETNDKNAVAFHIGGERYAVVKRFKGRVFVNLREYYAKEGSSKLLAGKKGLNLTSDEWKQLAEQSANITAALNYV